MRSNGHRNQIMPLSRDDFGAGKFTRSDAFADFLGRQQMNHPVDFGRIGIAASDTALAPALAQLQALGLPNGQWQDRRQESGGRWIVVMGPYKTPDLLQKKQQELRGLKITADELVNHPRLSPGLSLGQFASPAEAEARLAQVGRQGAHSARVEVLVPARVEHLLRVSSLSAEQVSRLSAAGDGPRWQACDAIP